MALSRNRSGLLIVDLLTELNTAWPQHTEVYCNEDETMYIRRGAGFDNSNLGGNYIGLSINGGASAAWTVTQVIAEAKW